jgi:hypothetical protein
MLQIVTQNIQLIYISSQDILFLSDEAGGGAVSLVGMCHGPGIRRSTALEHLVVPCRATTVLEVCINMNFRDCGQDSRKVNGYLTRASHAAA